MTDAKRTETLSHCRGFDSVNLKRGFMLAERLYRNIHPEDKVEVEHCMDCGTVTFKATIYFYGDLW